MKSLLQKLTVLTALVLAMTFFVNTNTVEAARKYNVTFIYGNSINTQKVKAGKDAVVPTDTAVAGFIFAGWTDTAANIQCDKVILGMYTPNAIQPSASKAPVNNPVGGKAIKANNDISAPGCDWWDYSLKGIPGQTCVVRWYNGHNGELWKTEVVPYGATLDDPGNPCISGYDFIGWVGSWENITEDRNIMAWYMHQNKMTFEGDENGGKYATLWVHDDQGVQYPDAPENIPDGYTFVRWEAMNGNPNKANEDINFKPVFKNNKYGYEIVGYP